MLKVIIGFLPWIIYSLLVSVLPGQHVLAVLVALCLTVISDELKKGFILAWGTFCFFLFMLFGTYFFSEAWLEYYANVIANGALAVITWFSLAINKPFTLQYAKEQVPPEFWNSPLFLKVNQIITAVWGLCFTLCVVTNFAQLRANLVMDGVYESLTYAFIIAAVLFTKVFPDWYKQRQFNALIARSEIQQKDNPFLKNNFAPLKEEYDLENLEVEGQIPQDLKGIYMRNGPNPAYPPFSYTYPLDGDGMLHAMYLGDGKARYKNRFIETDQLQVERRFGKAIYGGINCPAIRDSESLKPGDSEFPVKIGRFIHIIRHGKLYLALHEANSAYQVDRELNTIGEWNPTKAEHAIEVNAHTRLDPNSGQLYIISYFSEPIMRCHVLDTAGQVMESVEFQVPFPAMVHDFVITQQHVIIFLCPVVVDFSAMGEKRHFFEWTPELNTHIAILDRSNLAKEPQWIETESFFTFHLANAYEKDEDIIVDYVRYPKFDVSALGVASLYRSIINLPQKTCVHRQIDEHRIEFPRINENFNSLPNRYIYCPVNLANPNVDLLDALIKFDMETGKTSVHSLGEHAEVGEMVFAPKLGATREDEGYVLLFVYDNQEKKSQFLILDAENFSAPPIAKVKLPIRVPHGLHGSWFAE
ncbi:MAG: hypothetical protein EPN84_08330 [Legionella sp.]|nr:MAG: hypothetical protein EPN84_08330 [Legionella sp.]